MTTRCNHFAYFGTHVLVALTRTPDSLHCAFPLINVALISKATPRALPSSAKKYFLTLWCTFYRLTFFPSSMQAKVLQQQAARNTIKSALDPLLRARALHTHIVNGIPSCNLLRVGCAAPSSANSPRLFVHPENNFLIYI